MLVEENKLDAVIKLPSGVFRPYAGVSTAILCFTRTGVGGTDHVWFYDVKADGWSLDDKRQPLLTDDKLGPTPALELSEAEAAKNDLPDLVKRFAARDGTERDRPRTARSFGKMSNGILQFRPDLRAVKARQVFLRSARQANFFEHGEDRLVRPASNPGPGTPPADLEPKKETHEDLKTGSGGGGDPPTIDPIIDGLLKRLPKTGDVWPEADRKLWLQLLEGSFKLIYKDAAPKIPPPPGDAEYRKAQGMPPPPDDKGIMG
jgi:hypothetical protein